ncbi:amino acid ABC transporter permease [Nonomuraea pusilla]|uniref:Glutamate transport system permease protein n=1 Tax=Nonomuraea pusilla TaxID=46177 RepID=A0A1H7S632_9ACTN|nr:amino acid ABC transporter permease [Nonomuraea pusilla]SEL67828.1 glutamate transport system permease protein [Nonomuraea pusilla]
MSTNVLFDLPGPRTRLRNNVLTLLSAAVLLLIAYLVIAKLGEKGQLDAAKWEPFLRGDTWTGFIIPGLISTLQAAAVAAVLAMAFGVLFGLGRLSDHRVIRVFCGGVVEFFRAIPLLILIFFVQAGPATLSGYTVSVPAFWAVVVGLTLYNGSVLAEIVRAGILAVPRGQSEAAYAIGLRKSEVMRLVLVPQATTAMMPAIVSQMVVLLKDTALGWIIAYEDLLNNGLKQFAVNYGNLIPSAIVLALIYVAINLALGWLAHRLERRNRRSRKSAAGPVTPPSAIGTGGGRSGGPGREAVATME